MQLSELMLIAFSSHIIENEHQSLRRYRSNGDAHIYIYIYYVPNEFLEKEDSGHVSTDIREWAKSICFVYDAYQNQL
mgnify:FL=1